MIFGKELHSKEVTAEFAQLIKKELEANIKRQRNYPALIFWAGDNELSLGYKPADNWPMKQFHLNNTIPLLNRLDPSRPFRISSPLGIDPTTNNSLKSGDSHTSSFYNIKDENYRLDIDTMSAGRFMSEYFAVGLPNRRQLLEFMTEEDLLTGEMLEYHTKDNPYHPSGLTLYRRLAHDAEVIYGKKEVGSDLWISQQEYWHYEVIRLGMEANRRRKFYSSGINFWMFNDQWPASGWSLTTFNGERKAGYYGAMAGSRPVIAASHVEGKEIVWTVTSDLIEEKTVSVKVLVQPTEGGKPRLEKTLEVKVPANLATEALRLPLDETVKLMGDDAVLVCQINYDDLGYDRSYWTKGLPQDVKYPQNNLDVKVVNNGVEGTVTLKSDKWARVVNMDAVGVDFEDNYFEMLPGEERVIKWKSHKGKLKGDIKVSSWN